MREEPEVTPPAPEGETPKMVVIGANSAGSILTCSLCGGIVPVLGIDSHRCPTPTPAPASGEEEQVARAAEALRQALENQPPEPFRGGVLMADPLAEHAINDLRAHLARLTRELAEPLRKRPCGHEAMLPETCVHCAYEIGRRAGRAELGDYVSHEDAMKQVDATLTPAPTPSPALRAAADELSECGAEDVACPERRLALARRVVRAFVDGVRSLSEYVDITHEQSEQVLSVLRRDLGEG
jgi:hypothetical protein